MNRARIGSTWGIGTALMALVCCLLLGTPSCADTSIGTLMEVVNCREYVTLRIDPDKRSEELARLPLGERVTMLGERVENGFCLVGTEYGKGYVLVKYLSALPDEVDNAVSIDAELTQAQRADINLFLSNFTESDFGHPLGYFDMNDDRMMIDFAINHIWFNRHNQIEWVDDGEYNVRLAEEAVLPVCEKYFGFAPTEHDSRWVDLTDGYYRWTETGGHVSMGFAQATSVSRMGEDWYVVYFERYGTGENWSNDCTAWTIDQARAQFDCSGHGMAIFVAENLNDRSTYKLLKYAFTNVYE